MSKKDRFSLRPPSLIEILQSILRQYPPDGQILKELIQNADDAGATEIKFLLDDTQYGTNQSKFHHPGLAEFQGPALYAYNNGKFEDKDWESIGLINRSQKESDPIAVGRFGLGFKSVFHMTDLPCLIADDTIGFIDPHEKYFRTSSGDRRSTYLWDLNEDRDSVLRLADQFQPFQLALFGLDSNVLRNGNYENQTLFRFPLRKKPSELSPTIFTTEDVLELFRSLEKEAFSILLFLNSLEKIEVYQRQNGAKEKMLLSIRLENQCLAEVRQKRQQYKSILRNESCSEGSVTFLTVIEKECFENGMPTSKENQCWAMSLYHENKKASEPIESIMDKLKVKPVAGSALLLYTQRGLFIQPFASDVPRGNIFCFLPLPLEMDSPTGLKVHVNAYFALEQNRRYLKWPSADQDPKKVSEEGSRWNIHLVENTIPNSLIKLITHLTDLSEGKVETNPTVMEAIRYCQRCDVRYLNRRVEAVFPNSNTLKTNWKRIEKSFFERISENKIFFYSQPPFGTVWLSAFSSNAVFAKLRDFERDPSLYDALAKYLLKGGGRHLVYTPEYILNSLDKYCRRPNTIQPISLCSYVRATSGHNTTDAEKYAIIDYLCDCETAEISKHLIGLELIPLNDGKWTQFRQRSMTPIIYIPNEQHSSSLLPSVTRVFLLENLNRKRRQFFDRIAKRKDLNISFLDASGVISLLDEIPGISSGSSHPVYNSNPGAYGWLVRLWNYARSHGVELELCQKAKRLHVMPADRNAEKLVTLGSGKKMVINSSDEMENIYRAFDVQVLTGISRDINCEMMIQEGYVVDGHELSALMDVVRAQFRLCGEEKMIKMCENMKESDRRIFQRSLYDSYDLWGRDTSDVELVRRLPIFYTLPNSGSQSRCCESARNVTIGTRQFSTMLALAETVLDLGTETENYLGQRVGVKLLTEKELILNYVAPQMLRNPGSNETIMQHIFLEYSHLFTHYNEDFSRQMKAVRFIRSNSGGLFSAEQLYDDDDPLIRELFAAESRFPAGKFGSSEYRHFLQILGLRQMKDISVEDLIPVARRFHNSGSNVSPTTSRAFLDVLDRLAICGQDLKPFRNIKCVKSINHSAATPTDSKCLQGSFFKPNEILSKEFASLVGFVKPLIDTEGLDNLTRVFDWTKPPPIQDILRQLLLLIDWFQKDQQTAQCVLDTRRMCEDIYGFLEQCLSTNPESNELIISDLGSSPCIFSEICFLEPTRCAFDSNLGAKCSPLLSSLPATLASCYPRLFECLGVKQKFKLDDFLWALEQLHDLSSNEPHLHTATLEKSLQIISCIDTSEPKDSNRSVYIPNGDGKLCNAKDLCFSGGIETSSRGGNQCHPHIPPTLAAYLGARSQKQVILNSHLVAIDGLPFGQSEELVSRIQRILTGYPMDHNILKEMLQNADDAGATKLHFIIDPRRLPDGKIFDEHWKPIQGPALCVYNDRPFTAEDISGIQNLGHGSKCDDSSKVGKFGVGFNCVYHLTDAPTLLCQVKGEGERLCIFDPTLQFVPFATDIRPGYMFTNLESLKLNYPDVFLGFLEKEYGVGEGTMFRLALRQTESRISKETVSVQRLHDLFKKFENESHECLIFLKNVREISLREVDERTNEIKELFTVKASVKDEGGKGQEKIVEKCKSIAAWIKDAKPLTLDLQSVVAPTEAIYDLVTEDSEHLRCEWKIVERVGFRFTNSIQLPNVLKNREIGSIPYGGLAIRTKLYRRKMKETEYEHPKQRDTGRIYIHLPLDAPTELPVQLNGYFALEYENRRNIWKETAGGDKAEWNYFLMRSVVAPAYCQLLSIMRPRTETLTHRPMGSIHTEIRNYQNLFPDSKSSHVEQVKKKPQPKSYSDEMIITVYRNIAVNNMKLFPVYRNDMSQVEWIGINGNGLQLPHFDDLQSQLPQPLPVLNSGLQLAHFYNLQSQLLQPFPVVLYSSKNEREKLLKHQIMRQILVRSGMQLIITPSNHIQKNMKFSEVTIHSTTAESVFAFFKNDPNSKRKRKLSETPFEDIEGLTVVIQYVLSKDNKEVASKFWTCLIDTPFLLTEDDMLQVFKSDDLRYFTKFSKLFPPSSDQFVKYEIAEVIQDSIRSVARELDLQKSKEVEDTKQKLTKSFQFKDFATMLPKLLPMNLFGSNSVRLRNELNGILNKHCWTNVSVSDLSKWWLIETWKFISSELLCGEESDKQQAGERLNMLKNWSLLPVKCDNDEKLLQIGKSSAVFVYSEMKDRVKEDMLIVLKKIRVPQPNDEILFKCGNKSRLMECLFHTKQDAAVAVVNALLAGDYATAVSGLDDEEKACLFQFLVQNQHQWKDKRDQSDLKGLLLLPIYQSYSGQRVAGNNVQTFIFPKDVPKAGFDLWSNELSSSKGTVFLQEIDQLVSEMLLFLGCRKLNILSVYCRFIFSRFHLLRDEDIVEHMTFIKDNVMHEIEHSQKTKRGIFEQIEIDKFLSALKTLKFLRKRISRELVCASALFDSENSIFSAFEDPDNLIIYELGSYDISEWQEDFLIKYCGLISEVTLELLLKYARSLPGTASDSVSNKFKALLDHIKDMKVDALRKYSQEALFKQLTTVEFVPLGLVSDCEAILCPQYGYKKPSEPAFACFKESILFKHRQLAWSSSAILTETVESMSDEVLQIIGVKLEPTVNDVMSHLKNLSESETLKGGIDDNSSLKQTLDKVLEAIYEFFMCEFKKSGNFVPMSDPFPCIAVKNGDKCVLVKPIHVTIHLETEINPYLYRLPQSMMKFLELLRSWGVVESPDFSKYALVLSEIRRSAANKCLSEEDKYCCRTALNGVFDILSMNDPKCFTDINSLCLPGEDMKMHESSDLIVCDDSWFADRLKALQLPYMARSNQSFKLDITNESVAKLLQKLPLSLRPRFLTNVVTETLLRGLAEANTEFLTAVALQNRLRGKWFKQGLFRLFKDALAASGDQNLSDRQIWQFVTKVNDIEIKGLKRVATSLEYDGRAVWGSEKDRNCFVDGSVVYLSEVLSRTDDQGELRTTLSEVIDRICSGYLRSRLHVVSMILEGDEVKISQRLDNLKIRECDAYRDCFIPAEGELVPPAMHCLMKQEDWEDFQIGKLVAYEVNDLIDSSENTKDEAEYVFAKVVDRVEYTYQSALNKFRINVGRGVETLVFGKSLYKFYKPELLNDLPDNVDFSSIDMCFDTKEDFIDVQGQPFIDCIETMINCDVYVCFEEQEQEKAQKNEQEQEQYDEEQDDENQKKKIRKAIRRLYLGWHPELNTSTHGNRCTDAKSCIRELFSENQQYFRLYDERASRYRNQLLLLSRVSSEGRQISTDAVSHSAPSNWSTNRVFTTPCPREARRFIKQAAHDLEASVNDRDGLHPSYEWSCYKCHQAAEKALKALQFLESSEQQYIHTLFCLGGGRVKEPLRNLVTELERKLPNHATMRYPCYDHGPNSIPHELFNEETALEVADLARKIVEMAQKEFVSGTPV